MPSDEPDGSHELENQDHQLLPAVVLDACILVPVSLCDLLLRCAASRLYRPYWSGRILEETARALADLKDDARSRRRVDAMRHAFPGAMMVDYERYERDLMNHPKDRHVVAAAILAGASGIVTANLKDFPASALAPHKIEAMSPDRFLHALFREAPDVMVQIVVQQAAQLTNPPITVDRLLVGIARDAPTFADSVRSRLGDAH